MDSTCAVIWIQNAKHGYNRTVIAATIFLFIGGHKCLLNMVVSENPESK